MNTWTTLIQLLQGKRYRNFRDEDAKVQQILKQELQRQEACVSDAEQLLKNQQNEIESLRQQIADAEKKVAIIAKSGTTTSEDNIQLSQLIDETRQSLKDKQELEKSTHQLISVSKRNLAKLHRQFNIFRATESFHHAQWVVIQRHETKKHLLHSSLDSVEIIKKKQVGDEENFKQLGKLTDTQLKKMPEEIRIMCREDVVAKIKQSM